VMCVGLWGGSSDVVSSGVVSVMGACFGCANETNK
jgi:hypothetical protein